MLLCWRAGLITGAQSQIKAMAENDPLKSSRRSQEEKVKLPAHFRVLIRRIFKDQEDRLILKSLSALHILCPSSQEV